MTRLILIGVLEAVSFFVCTLNIRACSKGWIKTTVGTDMLIAANVFILTRLIVEVTSLPGIVCYVLGAAGGSILGMHVTRGWADVDTGRSTVSERDHPEAAGHLLRDGATGAGRGRPVSGHDGSPAPAAGPSHPGVGAKLPDEPVAGRREPRPLTCKIGRHDYQPLFFGAAYEQCTRCTDHRRRVSK